MARTSQKLINYHTGKKTEMPSGSSVDFGEIVVRHNAETPELLIKIGDDSFGVFQASGAVQTAIGDAKVEIYNSATTFATNAVNAAKEELNSAINAVASNVETLSGAVSSITENYVTKTDFEIAQGELFNSATTVASNDATTKANKAKDDAIAAAAASAITLSGLIDGVDDKVDADVKALADYKTEVSNTYATKTSVTSDIATAKSEAISAAATDAKEKADAAQTAAINAAAASADTLNTSIETVDGKVDTLSGNVHTRIEGLESGLTKTINEKVAVAYRYQGTKTNYADLPTSEMSKDTVGYVYNVENANGNYPAGTNYAWNGTEWDALGGSVDLSPYALKTEVSASAETLNNKIETVSTSLETFKTTVDSTYATKTGVTEDIKAAKSEVYTSATTAAFAEAKSKADAAYSSAITAAAASAETLNTSIEAVDNKVTGLSASTVTIQGIANTAIQNVNVIDGCGATIQKSGTLIDFDFSTLVIDCGDF